MNERTIGFTKGQSVIKERDGATDGGTSLDWPFEIKLIYKLRGIIKRKKGKEKKAATQSGACMQFHTSPCNEK